MNFRTTVRILARMLGVVAILFISVFALDSFAPDRSPAQIAQALLIHLIPSFALMIMLAIAWRHEIAGGLLFVLISLVPFLLQRNPFAVDLLLSAPFLTTGLLFLLSGALHHDRGANTAGSPGA